MVNKWIFFVLSCACFGGELRNQYVTHCSEISDINEHLPRLKSLAAECGSVTEIGVREMVSTWALLQGLSESAQDNRSYIGIDLVYPPLNQLFLADELAQENGIDFQFVQANDFGFDLKPTDLLFIDSWHTYCHLTYELETFSPKVRKLIVMHDTSEPWGDQDEPFYAGVIPDYPTHINRNKRGLWPAVADFLATHPEWSLRERRFNNHGFTVLERKGLASLHTTQEPSKLPDDPRVLYIDLMKKILVNTIYEDGSFQGEFDPLLRDGGQDQPQKALTMVGMKRLNNIHDCLEKILQDQIPGDCIETGVWRGGCTILMRAILKAYGEKTRKVWVADSYSGVPAPNVEKYPADSISSLHTDSYYFLAVPLNEVQNNFKKFGLLDNQVIFLKGLFSETLPTAPIEQLALLRLDGDLYESTMDALVTLYPKLSIGGFIIIDDFGVNPNCVQAVHDYRKQHGIEDSISPVDFTGIYWRKTH